MSQINEEAEGSNVVGDGSKVDLNPTGVAAKHGEPIRRKVVEEMKTSLKERASRLFKGTKKQ